MASSVSRRRFFGLTVAGATLGLLQARAAAAEAAEPKRGGTFTLALTAALVDFNPMRTTAGHYPFMRSIYSTLIRQDFQLQPHPDLAERWNLSQDGKSMTVKLREGVKFHSGREFTSADVKYSWEFASTDSSVTQLGMFKTVKGVETPEKYVAVLKFDGVNPSVFDILDTLYMVDKENFPEKKANTAVGTGPFKLEKYVPNDRFECVAFKDYWDKGKPYLDRYITKVVPDPGALAINLESGAVDCIRGASYLDVVRLGQSGGKYSVHMGPPGLAFFDVAINCKTEPFTNKKVRQAVAWAVDRARFCRTTLQGLAEPTTLIWPPTSWAYFKDLEGRLGYDLEKAKALLKEAGFPNGFETELITSATYNFAFNGLANILQADLGKIGIKARLKDVDTATYTYQFVNKREYAMAMQSYGRANRDPGSTVTAAKAWTSDKEGSWTRFESAEWDGLRKALNSTLDRAQRLPIARQIQEMALDECFTIVAAPNLQPWVHRSYVKGHQVDLDNSNFTDAVWLER